MEYIAFDVHKHYTVASVARSDGRLTREERVEHDRGALRHFLERCEHGSPVAVETVGNWYWIVDEIEAAGCLPRLVHARKAKLMMGMINKTDKLDARGLNQLQRNGTLPTVWIPPGELRDQRELPRTRMALVRQRTQLKNRIHAALAKYALHDFEVSDAFGAKGRDILRHRLSLLPPHTAYATQQLLEQVEELDRRVRGFELRMRTVFKVTPDIQLLLTLPGVGLILAVVIALEVGTVARFGTAEKLAGYAGTTPRVPASGGKTRFGRLRPDVNRYLKWAFVEATLDNAAAAASVSRVPTGAMEHTKVRARIARAVHRRNTQVMPWSSPRRAAPTTRACRWLDDRDAPPGIDEKPPALRRTPVRCRARRRSERPAVVRHHAHRFGNERAPGRTGPRWEDERFAATRGGLVSGARGPGPAVAGEVSQLRVQRRVREGRVNGPASRGSGAGARAGRMAGREP
jgi:transposase